MSRWGTSDANTKTLLKRFGISSNKLDALLNAVPLSLCPSFAMPDLASFSTDVHDCGGARATLHFTSHVTIQLHEPSIAPIEHKPDGVVMNALKDEEEEVGDDDDELIQPISHVANDTLQAGWYDLYTSSKCTDAETTNVCANDARQTNYTALELFAGCGGLALGMAMAGIKSVGLVEMDKHCCSTLKHNRPQWLIHQANVWDAINDAAFLAKVKQNIGPDGLDIMTGGFPCQSFSSLGKNGGMDDQRGMLFVPFASLVKQFRPRVIMAENVKGLTTHDQGKTLALILQEFAQYGYKMHWRLVDASQYGVPQSRCRLIIIGIRNDLAGTTTYHFPSPLTDPPITLREALHNVPSSPHTPYPEKKRALFTHIPEGGNWKDLPESTMAENGMSLDKRISAGKLFRLSWDKPCPTVLTTPGANVAERCHPKEDRPLTIRETARVQSFPDDWEIKGPIGSAYKQLGNAVPVQLAKMIGLSIISFLDRLQPAKRSPLEM